MTVAHFHRLRICDIRQETEDAKSLAFTVPPDLESAYRFIQGQHLTLRKIIDGKDLRRSYSVCVGVDDGELRVVIKRIPDGLFSNWAHERLQVGDEIEVMPPLGRFFTPLDPTQQKHYLAVAAGSGITPVMSILTTTLATETASHFTLIYGNRDAGSIIFRNRLSDLKSRYPDRLHLVHVLSRQSQEIELFNGRIDAAKLRALESIVPLRTVDEVFLCGPQAMIDDLRACLKQDYKLSPKQIHFELFGTGIVPVRKPVKSGPMRHVTVIVDGKKTRIDMPTSGEPILDAALNAGVDLPYACKGGVCCTCRARVLEGNVAMDLNYALESEELEAGFVLTCQAHPTSDQVVVDFDVR